MNQDQLKAQVGQHAADYIDRYLEHDSIVGVGTGSTANCFIDSLAKIKHKFDGTVASSIASAERLKNHGIPVYELNDVNELVVYVDGADEANSRLELIKGLGGVAVGMPTILVTAYPSTESAIESLGLPVMGYLVKPFEFEELLGQVETSIERYQSYRSVRDLRTRLRDWSGDLERIEENLVDPPRAGESVPVDAFISMQLKNILHSLTDIFNLTSTISGQLPAGDTCSLMGCPRLAFMTETVEESIKVLRESKRAFKSKILGQLREKLEVALKQGPSKDSPNLS
ncbi:MAG: ribose-5-phosphate isomerase A [Proteobacteria bacterium]|nr:ribose-5-phosphate isomerase A [Pseudomonadota bacterium]